MGSLMARSGIASCRPVGTRDHYHTEPRSRSERLVLPPRRSMRGTMRGARLLPSVAAPNPEVHICGPQPASSTAMKMSMAEIIPMIMPLWSVTAK